MIQNSKANPHLNSWKVAMSESWLELEDAEPLKWAVHAQKPACISRLKKVMWKADIKLQEIWFAGLAAYGHET